jgi:cytochrome c55X
MLAALAVPPARAADDNPRAEAGRTMYTSSCARCHGIRLVSNGIGFDLRTFPREDKERFVRSVNKGLRAMPAWEGVLKPDDIEAIWAYIGSVNGWTEAGP